MHCWHQLVANQHSQNFKIDLTIICLMQPPLQQSSLHKADKASCNLHMHRVISDCVAQHLPYLFANVIEDLN